MSGLQTYLDSVEWFNAVIAQHPLVSVHAVVQLAYSDACGQHAPDETASHDETVYIPLRNPGDYEYAAGYEAKSHAELIRSRAQTSQKLVHAASRSRGLQSNRVSPP
jgi:hypothetical protein